MDPQQRVLLHCVQAALDDAGYVPDSTATFQRETTGCYVGVATGDYVENLRDDIDVFYSPGQSILHMLFITDTVKARYAHFTAEGYLSPTNSAVLRLSPILLVPPALFLCIKPFDL